MAAAVFIQQTDDKLKDVHPIQWHCQHLKRDLIFFFKCVLSIGFITTSETERCLSVADDQHVCSRLCRRSRLASVRTVTELSFDIFIVIIRWKQTRRADNSSKTGTESRTEHLPVTRLTTITAHVRLKRTDWCDGSWCTSLKLTRGINILIIRLNWIKILHPNSKSKLFIE